MPEQPFPNFPESGLICAVSRRHFNNMSLSYGDTANSLASREKFLRKLGIDYRDLICAKQTHADKTRCVGKEDKGKGALSYDTAIGDTDALITDEPDLPLAIFTADCLSVFLYDPKTPAIGLVHAGWKSSSKNIIAKAIQSMREKFSSRPEYLQAAFGPAIRSCCCEVGDDFNDYFPGGLIERGGRHYLDLPAINRKQMLDAGVKEANIFDSGGCTFCNNEEFFSYRKEGDSSGRIMSVIMLTG